MTEKKGRRKNTSLIRVVVFAVMMLVGIALSGSAGAGWLAKAEADTTYGTLTIKAVDVSNGVPVPGAKFKIWAYLVANDTRPYKTSSSASPSQYRNKNIPISESEAWVVTTSSDGTYTISGLPMNYDTNSLYARNNNHYAYYVKEIEAPSDYYCSGDEKGRVLWNEKGLFHQVTDSVPFAYSSAGGTAVVTVQHRKVDSPTVTKPVTIVTQNDGGAPLGGVQIKVYPKDETQTVTVDGEAVSKDNPLIVSTGADGKVSVDLPETGIQKQVLSAYAYNYEAEETVGDFSTQYPSQNLTYNSLASSPKVVFTYTKPSDNSGSNSGVAGATSIPVKKYWSLPKYQGATDANVSSIKVELYEKGSDVRLGELTLKAPDWSGEFNEDNVEGGIDPNKEYEIREVYVEGWTTTYSSTPNEFSVVNTKKGPEMINIPVTKYWRNTTASDRKPIKLHLKDGNKIVQTLNLSGSTSSYYWTGQFTNVPKGPSYTIEEEIVDPEDNYFVTTEGDAENGYTITNEQIPVEKFVETSKVKKTSSEDPAKLAEDSEEFTYTIETKIPENAADLTAFTVTDELKPVLKYVAESAKVKIGGNEVDVQVTEKGKTLTWELKDFCADNAGAKVEISFKAKIDGENATEEDLAPYKVDGECVIPNKSTLKINNNPDVTSNTVNITPPDDKPPFEKTVETSQTKTNNKSADAKKNETMKYTVTTRIPLAMKTMNVVDKMDEALVYQKDAKVTIGGKAVDLKPTVNGQVLTWKFDNYKKYMGEKVVITYSAKFAESATQEQLESGVPNDAGLEINGEPAGNHRVVVNVTKGDKPTNPGLEKFVTTEKTDKSNSHGDLVAKDEIFTYTLESKVPKNAKTFVIGDELEPVLSYISDSAEVLIDGMVATDVTPTVKGNKITFDLSAYCSVAAGKSVAISFDATIRSGADLSKYIVNGKVQIPNQATYQIDDKTFESNTVTVTPPEKKDTPKDKGSKTGDSVMLGLIAALLIASLAGAMVVARRRRRA